MEAQIFTEEDTGKVSGRRNCSKQDIALLINKEVLKYTGSVEDYRPLSLLMKLDDDHYHFINEKMAQNDELMAIKLLSLLKEEFPKVSVSVSMVKRGKRELGWVVKKLDTTL